MWRRNEAVGIMETLLKLKYKQVSEFKTVVQKYIATGRPLNFVEATRNKYWGCGATLSEISRKKAEFTGENVLGHMITKLCGP